MIRRLRIPALALVLLLSGCVARTLEFERAAYVSLVTVQEEIEETRPRIESGELPAFLLGPFNLVVDAYNEARAVGQAYDAGRGDIQSVNDALIAMQQAWNRWREARAEVETQP